MITLEENIAVTGVPTLLTIEDEVQLGTWGMHDLVMIEAPVQLGLCQIEVGFIGAFSAINVGKLHAVNTNSRIEAERIGRFCSIAHGVNIGLINHAASFLSTNRMFAYDKKMSWALDYMQLHDYENEKKMQDLYIQASKKPLPFIGNDVWIGYGATILNGVSIGDGAIIGAGAVVTKDIPPYTVAGGVPAHIIRQRTSDKNINKLEKLQWWNYGPDILTGLDISSIENCIEELEERIISKKCKKFESPYIQFDIKKNDVKICNVEKYKENIKNV